MKHMHNNVTTSVLLTVASTYGAYIVSDSLCHSSGVLSVVTLGKAHPQELLSSSRSTTIPSNGEREYELH